jgi:hypothetical protein
MMLCNLLFSINLWELCSLPSAAIQIVSHALSKVSLHSWWFWHFCLLLLYNINSPIALKTVSAFLYVVLNNTEEVKQGGEERGQYIVARVAMATDDDRYVTERCS